MSIFSKVKTDRPPYSTFDLSHQKKLSGRMGRLIPICVMDTVPGDQFKIQTAQLCRMAPMIAPIMHQITVYTHYFFVPNRILWPEWETFITGGETAEEVDVAFPYLQWNGDIPNGTIADYLGIPRGLTSIEASALPFAAYLKIFNEYYRDQNLINKLPDELQPGPQVSAFVTAAKGEALRRAWQHDYFTSALPWTQKGPEATIPLGLTAPVTTDVTVRQVVDPVTGVGIGAKDLETDGTSSFIIGLPGPVAAQVIGTGVGTADLSAATAATINELRSAFRLQEWLEKNARGGTRYVESILSHFGVVSSDARLQRPEFLGGGSVPLSVSEVLQTSSTDATTPQGNMSGHGIAAGQSSQISYRCEEHGWVIGLMSIMPKTAYQDGLPKMYKRLDKFDYYWPSFAHLGEQAIRMEEVYRDSADKDATFGYTPRYAEYKYINDTVHGEFRTTLDFWHLGRKFASEPALNEQFIQCEPDDRIFAVQDKEHFYCQIYNKVTAKRPMPYFGTPRM